jgi:trimethylamine--corrinoid protein Co-methyltransferase
MQIKLGILSEKQIKDIVQDAYRAIKEVGVSVQNKEAEELLLSHSAKMLNSNRISIPEEMIEKALSTVPSSIKLYDRNKQLRMNLEGDYIHFNPGSVAINILVDNNVVRKPTVNDYIEFTKVVEKLEHIDAQSTAMKPADVPEEISDLYRLFIALQYCTKPVITGTFGEYGFKFMKEMLIVIRDSKEQLKKYPLAIFDCCPSPGLRWEKPRCQDLIECARLGIPSELISMPQPGLTSSITLYDSLVQHAAETLSGIVIAQLACSGAPVIYGGSPVMTNLRSAAAPALIGDSNTHKMDCAYVQIGKFFGLPTHSYMGLTDSKLIDFQAGAETSNGIILAALAGINNISGPGMLDCESCQSTEKLIIDNEYCGSAKQFVKEIKKRNDPLEPLRYLTTPGVISDPEHTVQWLEEEHFEPSKVIYRDVLPEKPMSGKTVSVEKLNIFQRAREKAKEILNSYEFKPLETHKLKHLKGIVNSAGEKVGFSV